MILHQMRSLSSEVFAWGVGGVAGVAAVSLDAAALSEGVEPACDGHDAVHHDQPPDGSGNSTGTKNFRDGEAVLENHVANEANSDGGNHGLDSNVGLSCGGRDPAEEVGCT